MPTFHHWRAGTQRNGLTFQTAADARAFDKGVVRAYNELIDGMHNDLNIYTHIQLISILYLVRIRPLVHPI